MNRLSAKFIHATPRFLSIALTAAALSLTSSAYANPNLVVNGNFDAPNVGGGWNIFPNGGVPGWVNVSNNDGIEIDRSAILGGPAYPGTTQSAELDGNVWDSIGQTVSGLTVGDTYALSWAYGQRPGSGYQLANVFFGGNLVTTDVTTGYDNTLTWSLNTFDVTATSTSETLVFAAVPGLGAPSVGNEITAVSLTNAVPEPSTVLLVALGAFFLFGRRKNT